MLKKLTLPPEEYKRLKLHCNEIGIGFASAPFEKRSIPRPLRTSICRLCGPLRERFGVVRPQTGIEIPVAAAALGTVIIEKHFTLDRGMEGPDHKASLKPDELAAMAAAVRNIECALGTGEKT